MLIRILAPVLILSCSVAGTDVTGYLSPVPGTHNRLQLFPTAGMPQECPVATTTLVYVAGPADPLPEPDQLFTCRMAVEWHSGQNTYAIASTCTPTGQ